MPLQLLQQLPHRPVIRNGIADWLDPLKPEPTLLIANHHTPFAGGIPIGVLHVVVPRAVRLPDVDGHARDGVALGVFDGAESEHGLAFGVRGHGGTIFEEWCVVRVEGAEHGAFRAAGGLGVVDTVY